MKNHKKNATAFSLIELSIVILVIGILIAGIVQGSKLYDRFKLQVAKSLTNSSPVFGVKNLVLWYETSLDDSFSTTEAVDGNTISNWYSINKQKPIKLNATQSSSSLRPIYYENVLNGIPAIRFDGTDDYLSFDGSDFPNSNYTIFVVEQRRSSKANNWFISGSSGISNANLVLGYWTATTITASHIQSMGSFINYTIGDYYAPTPRIHCFMLNNLVGKKYYLNNSSSTATATNSNTSYFTAWSNSSIGSRYVDRFNGDIFEIIMFNRNLVDEERAAITKYLGQKYAITIS